MVMSDTTQKKIFVHNLSYYLAKYNKSQKEVADAIGVSPQTFNTWCQGIALPRMGKVQLLADYFNINKSDLIEDKPKQSPQTDIYQLIEENLDKSTAEAVKSYYQLDAEDRAEVRGEMKYMLKAAKYNQESELKNA